MANGEGTRSQKDREESGRKRDRGEISRETIREGYPYKQIAGQR